jgi:DNA polymerase elongation subunit (family B)
MTTSIHIFDSHARDQTIENEDETTIEVTYDDSDFSDNDEEFQKPSWMKSKPKQVKTYMEKRSMVIHLFGSTADGTQVRLQVNGFKPFFFLRLPDGKRETYDRTVRRLQAEFAAVNEEEQNDIIPESCVTFTPVQKRLLYGYTGGKTFPFIELKFQSLAVFRAVRKIVIDETSKPRFCLHAGNDPLEVYDANLDPMLRFFHLRKLQPCGWIQVEADLQRQATTGALEGECDWTQISPEPKPPRATAPFLMAAWDIECYSEDGEFPLPTRAEKKKKNRPDPTLSQEGDPVIQIGVVLVQQDKPTERHIFVIPHDPTSSKKDICDDIEGVTVHRSKTEKQMILNWAAWMNERNPDILVGYNTFGFDERYLWKRAEELKLTDDLNIQAINRLSDLGMKTKLEEKFLSSSALGDNYLYLWTSHGRLQVDLYHYVRRTASLASYKLDEVAKFYMSGKLKGIEKGANEWKILTKSTGDVQVGRYICLLDETGETLLDKVPITAIDAGKSLSIAAPPEGDELDLDDAVMWAMVKDDVPPQEIFRLHRGSSADRARVAAYCVQDCDLVVELYKKLDVFNNAMSMANVCSVPISYIFTRGQGIKIESLIFKDCYERDILVRVLPTPPRGSNKPAEAAESYEGAIVLDPTPGFYMKSPIGVCDFASLYPSTIISENISHDSLVWVKDYTLDGKLITDAYGHLTYGSEEDEKHAPAGTEWTDIEFDIWGPKEGDTRQTPEKVKKGVRVCRYAQPPDGSKHTLPDIVAKLLAARKSKRKEAEKESDPFRKALLDAEQLAYKLTANSLYGQLGSGTFKIRLQNLAASVTAYGRKQILFAKAAIEQFYGAGANDPRCAAEIVYGDTDSLFVNFNVKNPETGELLEGREAIVKTIEMTEEAGHLVTQCLKAPHDFEFDKVYYPFIIFSKKRYVGNKYEDSPDDFKQTAMGIVLRRRDNAPIAKTIYGGAIKILLNERDILKAIQFVKDKCIELVERRTSMYQLTITKSLSAKYKPDYVKADIVELQGKIARMEKWIADLQKKGQDSESKEEQLRVFRRQLDAKESELERVRYPPHKILAERMAKRDPGNAPAAGERVGFVYVSPPPGQAAPELQGDRIETPAYIREKNLIPDVRYYIDHQLINPLSQLFALKVEEMPGYTPPAKGYLDDSMRESIACELLFREALNLCDKHAIRDFATQRLGAEIRAPSESQMVRRSNRLESSKKAAPTSQKQTTLTAFLKKPIEQSTMDEIDTYTISKMLVEVKQKERRKAAASAAAAGESSSEKKEKKSSTGKKKESKGSGYALEA